MHEREDLSIGRLGNSLAGVQEIELHEESHARKLCTELLDEVGLRHRRATRGNQVVNDKHHIVFVERVGMDFEAVGSVFKLIALAAHFTRQLAGLASRHEAGTQAVRDRGANHEAAGLGAHNLGNACIFEMVGDSVNGCLETFWLL